MQLYLDSCVLRYALEGYGNLRRHTLDQLQHYASDDWVISDLVRLECLLSPMRRGDQMRLLAFRRIFADCRIIPLNSEVIDRSAEIRAAAPLPMADAIHLAAAQLGGCEALLTNDKAFLLKDPPVAVLRLDQVSSRQACG